MADKSKGSSALTSEQIKGLSRLAETNPYVQQLLDYVFGVEKELVRARILKNNHDILNMITTEISNSPDMGNLRSSVNNILRSMKNMLGYEEISIFLYNPEKDQLEAFASAFRRAHSDLEARLNQERRSAVFKPGTKEEGLVGYVFRTRETRYTETASKDPAFMGWKTDSDFYADKSFLTVPLRTNGDCIGVIIVMANYINKDIQGPSLAALANVLAQELNQQRTLLELDGLSKQHLLQLAYNFDMRNPYFAGHSVRVTDYSVFLARQMNLTKEEIACLKNGGLLHDVGKVEVDNRIVLKKGSLNKRETKIMHEHTLNGYRMVKSLHIDERIKDIVLHHHEWYNGEGYPHCLAGENIGELTQIISLADTWDAMLFDRPYRSARTFDYAREEIRRNRGLQFSPDLVDIFLDNYEAFDRLTRKLMNVNIMDLDVQRFLSDPGLLNNTRYLVR